METKDLWLLLAGAVVGYVINLMATFTAPSVGTAFGKLKSGFILVYMLFCIMGSIVGILGNPEIKLPSGVGAVFGLLMAIRRLAYLIITLNRIQNFEDYRAELLRRWPDVDLPDAK
jgi:hypothetical protein